jgi:GT2 family glycosyltransferase
MPNLATKTRLSVTKPSVSAVIVNWNHGHLLSRCLDALLAQDYSQLAIAVVDNASQDGSPDWIADRYPGVRLWRFARNLGFSAALNWGVSHTEGDFVLSLNPDVVVMRDFVGELVEAIVRDEEIGIVAPKLLQADNPAILDSTGLFIDRRRRPFDRGQGEPDMGQYDTLSNVFGACGAAALYRRSMLCDLQVGTECFDEDFFAYYEDADLSWRAQLQGWRSVHAPRAVATHGRGWGDTLLKRGRAQKGTQGPRLALRNRYLMVAKNDSLAHFLRDLPLILAAEVPRLAYMAVIRPQALLGLLDLIRGLPSARVKRRQLRTRWRVDHAAIRHWFVTAPEIAIQGDRT